MRYKMNSYVSHVELVKKESTTVVGELDLFLSSSTTDSKPQIQIPSYEDNDGYTS